MLVLETHSLRTTDASFSESLYGLRRRSVNITPSKHTSDMESNDRIRHSGLKKRQKVLSVAFLVILPYVKSKLHAIYNQQREARLQASLWGHDDVRLDDADFLLDQGEISHGQIQASSEAGSIALDLKRKIKTIIGACYPWIHATNEGLGTVLGWLCWSFVASHVSLMAWCGKLSNTSMNPVSFGRHYILLDDKSQPVDLRTFAMDSSSRISKIRSRERERLRGPSWLKAIQRVLLSCLYTTLDYAQTGLIAAVFFFKMMEWWYQSAEERMSAPTVYPPPPPPPPPKVARDGIPLPQDRTLCPLCSQKRMNPSVVTVSGFVFCYSCIFKYVSQYKRCPITLMPATVEHIRRLFHDL